jgi:hypothetical protein
MGDPIVPGCALKFRSLGNQPMRRVRATYVVNCGRSSLLVGMMFCQLVASVLVFVLISAGLPH